ncbi:MAG: phasin family protein, partial [Janthinobacterium sp.]
MFTNPEQFASATKALFEFQLMTFNTLTTKAVQGVEQVLALNMATAKSVLENSLGSIQAAAAATTPEDVLAASSKLAQPMAEKAAAYG